MRRARSSVRPWHLGTGLGSDGAFYIMAGERVVARIDSDSSLIDESNARLIIRAVNGLAKKRKETK